MARKSERNKSQGAQAAPEKVAPERGRKSTRAPRRKKKSESESEGEGEAHVEKETKEVGEPVESKVQAGTAPVDGEENSARARRSTRRNPLTQPDKEPENDKPSEWKEDPTFWGTEESAPEGKTIVDEGTTWKIQSSNGSGGEIQKLKICRQRVSESTDSSSPAGGKDASSPRRKRGTKSNKNNEENTESGGDASSSNETREEPKNEEAAESKDEPVITTSEAIAEPEPKESAEEEKPSVEESETSVQPPETSESVEEKKCEGDEVESSEQLAQDATESPGEKSRKPSTEEVEASEPKASEPSTEGTNEISEEKSKESPPEEGPPAAKVLTEEGEVVEDKTIVVEPKDEAKISESTNNNVEPRNRTKSETSDNGKEEKKTLSVSKVKVPVSSDVAMDEIAKKLNERAARFSDSKEKKRESVESTEPKSPREEGELTPVPEQLKRSKHTTIVINKPKEVTSQPTRLKRNTDELPPTERKRRILSKSKSKDKDEDPINISSQSLMLLVPEVKTITPEQVAAFPLDDEDLSKFELEQPPETKVKKKIELKPKEMEVRVENDTRHVVKKKPIVIDSKDNSIDSKPVGPKLPAQENHRVIRKISLMSEDSKKQRRSASPDGRSATEVLFITNLVRPFTVPQLRELLARTGTIAPNGFYIDKIKSKCYVKYTDVEMAVETRHALNGVRWPVNNPKTLKVEFATAEDMAIVQKLADEEAVTKKAEAAEPLPGPGWLSEQAALKPQRRVTAAVREWDMGKVGAGSVEEKAVVSEEWRAKQEPVEQKRRPLSPVELKYEPPPRKIKKRDNDAPARLLDDLFRKTKATPCIYWLPLTAAQIAVKEEMRRQHMADHERKLAELRKSDHGRRDKEREKSRDRRKK